MKSFDFIMMTTNSWLLWLLHDDLNQVGNYNQPNRGAFSGKGALSDVFFLIILESFFNGLLLRPGLDECVNFVHTAL